MPLGSSMRAPGTGGAVSPSGAVAGRCPYGPHVAIFGEAGAVPASSVVRFPCPADGAEEVLLSPPLQKIAVCTYNHSGSPILPVDPIEVDVQVWHLPERRTTRAMQQQALWWPSHLFWHPLGARQAQRTSGLVHPPLFIPHEVSDWAPPAGSRRT